MVSDLWKEYRVSGAPSVAAVRGISFEIREGECFGLLGPNGAGKSTSMRCITGFYPATKGRVEICGIDVHKCPREARQFLGVCSQEDTLDTDFSVINQMIRHAAFFGISGVEARQRSMQLLKQFGLSDHVDAHIESLSGGMRRRLQVARALVSSPRLLVLDEPTTGLDPEARRVLWDIIIECRKQRISVLLSTHYMDEAERLCDRIAILHKGFVIDCLPPSELIQKFMPEMEISEEVRPGVIWRRPPNLEDVYLKLTGAKLLNGDGI